MKLYFILLSFLFVGVCHAQKVTRILCSFWGIYNLVKRVMAEKEWGNTSRLAFCGASGKTLPAYAELEKKFENNPYFLYNYAAILLENKQYEESLTVALQCRKYWADYDLELMIGENYQELDKYELADGDHIQRGEAGLPDGISGDPKR